MPISFEGFVFDVERRVLLSRGRPVHLSPKAFRALELLLAERPKALGKSRLMEVVWPEVVVTESSLTNVINELRAALGEDRKSPRFIRTVHGFGYAFAAEASDPFGESALARATLTEPASSLAFLVRGPDRYDLKAGENLVGRDAGCAVRLSDPSVSRVHARLVVSSGRILVEDLGSKNGTSCGDVRLESPLFVRPVAVLTFGKVRMVLQEGSGEKTETVTELAR